MRLKKGYHLAQIQDNFYLLPYGQEAADLRNPIKILGTGADIMRAMQNEISFEELVLYISRKYQGNDGVKARIEGDIREFLAFLRSNGYIEELSVETTAGDEAISCPGSIEKPENDFKRQKPVVVEGHYYKIAGISLRIDAESRYIHRFMEKFKSDLTDKPDVHIEVKEYKEDFKTGLFKKLERKNEGEKENLISHNGLNEELIIKGSELDIWEDEENFIIDYKTNNYVKVAFLKKNGAYAEVLVDSEADSENGIYTRSEEFHYAVRSVFLLYAQSKGMAALHSVSVLHENKALLISAPSGTGKTTLARNLKRRYGAEQLNGDLNLLGMRGNTVVSYGIPWCGTSRICKNEDYPAEGIVFLKRGKVAILNKLSMESGCINLIHRIISPAWNLDGLEKNVLLAGEIAKAIPCMEFLANKGESSAVVLARMLWGM